MNRQASCSRTSLKRSIGSSDGRCVRRAGTLSTKAYDWGLLGIPGSRRTIASSDLYQEWGSAVYPLFSQREELADPFSVARARSSIGTDFSVGTGSRQYRYRLLTQLVQVPGSIGTDFSVGTGSRQYKV